MESQMKRFLTLVFIFINFLTIRVSYGLSLMHRTESLRTPQQAVRNIEDNLFLKIKSQATSSKLSFCPQGDGNPRVVKLSLDINRITLEPTSTQIARNKCVFDVVLRLHWNDPNLHWDNSNIRQVEFLEMQGLPAGENGNIWIPELDISGELSGKTTSYQSGDLRKDKNVATWIYPNGDVTYNIRDIWEVESSSSPSRNPVCRFTLGSFGCSEKSVRLQWDNTEAVRLKVNNERNVTTPFYTNDLLQRRIDNRIAVSSRSIIIEKLQMKTLSFPVNNFGKNETYSGLYFEIEAKWV